MLVSAIFLGLLAFGESVSARFARPPVRELRAQVEARAKQSLSKRDVDPETLYPAHNISVPIDFFKNESRYEPHTNDSFNLRYWFDASNYKEGGPVILLLSGETDGTGRLPFLQKGIVAQLTKATNGLGVILEHRYYGTSFPFKDISTENLRMLSTEQALAEIAYFATHVNFPGVDKNLTAPKTPWIVYGGSYAGAQAAFLRVTYPGVFWGAISSSGVTKSIIDYWEYFEPIRQFAPPDCVKATQEVTHVVDNILLEKNNTGEIQKLKDAFGFGRVTDNRDFANILTNGIYGWQGTNWDPQVNDPSFFQYCQNMSTTLLYPEKESLRPTVKELIAAGGYGENLPLENIFLNSIGYFGGTQVAKSSCKNITQDECFTTLNATYFQQDDIEQAVWRSWDYQVCTEWGFFQTGDTPSDILPLISRTIDLNYTSYFCKTAFNITSPPDIERVNKYGGFDINYDRLAIIGGNADPWRPATPLADAAKKRENTINKPVWTIAHGVHHWEENGVFPNQTTPILPPNQIVYAQEYLAEFVVEWLKDFKSKGERKEL